MGNVSKVVNIIVLIGAIAVGAFYYFNKPPTLDEVYLKDHYWGPKPWKLGDAIPSDDVSIKPFKVNIPESVLTDLEDRLNRTRLPSAPLQGVGFNYGMNVDTIKKVIKHWQTKYDWRSQEKLINKYNHFKTQIEGINIHYLHIKPDKTKTKLVVPLILCHGWPGSFVEFLKIIPLLTIGQDVAFELIIPSLPGYGFSEPSHRPGLDTLATARILSKLMTRLGHQHFLFHGGDWGAIVGKFMAVMYPNRVSAYHTTMPVVSQSFKDLFKLAIGEVAPQLVYDNVKDADNLHPLFDKLSFILRETGYMHLQCTKPDTIGTVLNDSPAGLAAYILEKFSTWTDKTLINEADGGLLTNKVKYSLDDLLTNVMIYWTTSSITTSQRYYKENAGSLMADVHRIPINTNVAVGISCFKHELICYPKTYLTDVFTNIVQYKNYDHGGHFAAFELPDVINADIRSLVSILNEKNKLWWAQTK